MNPQNVIAFFGTLAVLNTLLQLTFVTWALLDKDAERINAWESGYAKARHECEDEREEEDEAG